MKIEIVLLFLLLLFDGFCERWLSITHKFISLALLRLLLRSCKFSLSFCHIKSRLFSTRTFVPQRLLFGFLTFVLIFFFQNFGVLVRNLVYQSALLLKIRLLLQQLLIQGFTCAKRFLNLDVADRVLMIAASPDPVRDSFRFLESRWGLLKRDGLARFLCGYWLEYMMIILGLNFFISVE